MLKISFSIALSTSPCPHSSLAVFNNHPVTIRTYHTTAPWRAISTSKVTETHLTSHWTPIVKSPRLSPASLSHHHLLQDSQIFEPADFTLENCRVWKVGSQNRMKSFLSVSNSFYSSNQSSYVVFSSTPRTSISHLTLSILIRFRIRKLNCYHHSPLNMSILPMFLLTL